MTVSIGTIAQQALRRLGVRIVPLDDSPVLEEMVSAHDIAYGAAGELGILNLGTTPDTSARNFEEIATAALVELGVIAADETPSAADLALAIDKGASVHTSLQAKGIAWWDSNAIPTSFAEEYIKLTAAMAASSFGKAVDPAIVALLEGRIREGAIVLSASGAPSVTPGADIGFLLGKVASVHAALDAQGAVWWYGDAVPRAFVEEYIKLTVAAAAAGYGRPPTEPAVVAALEARIRKGVMVLSADDNAQQAVQAVHDDLSMRGIARWTSLDIPDAVGDAYATLAADRLAPLFAMDTDPKDAALAMVSLYRYVALPTSGMAVQATYF